MALVLKDRVQETTTTTGTGAVTLDGASTGFQAFDAVGNFNQTYYTITDGTNWEAGIGTFGELESSAALSLAFDETTTLDNRITFTRATNGTYFDSAGVLQTASSGVARFDHRLEGGVWVNKGLLIEEQRANISTRSEEFNDAAWTKDQVTVTANDTTAPDGTSTADKILETSSNSTHFVNRLITFTSTSASPTTLSCFIKGGLGRTRAFLQIVHWAGAFESATASIDLTAQTIVVSAANGGVSLGGSVQDCGNGWYRCSMSMYTGQTSASHRIGIYIASDAGASTYTGDTSKGLYFWGAQLEAGAFPTSYIKTTSASVTRNADVASMTSTNFSDWYNSTEGTVFWQGNLIGSSNAGKRGYAISNNTLAERILLTVQNASGVGMNASVVDNSSSSASFDIPSPLTAIVPFQTYKHSLAYKANDFAASLDGSAASTDTSGTLPTVDRLFLGSQYDGASLYLNGHIAKFYYWNTRLSNATLQYLSSSFGTPTVSRRLNRDTVLASSNSGAKVDFPAGTKTVFSPLPAIATQGSSATGDNSSIGTDLYAWNNFKKLLDKSVVGGVAYGNNGTNGIVSTYSLVYTTSSAFAGGVLAPNGDVYFIPRSANRGQKISASGVVSTYSLVYTGSDAYNGGVLAPNGDIHFVPRAAAVGQKISASGVVSTYSLIYTLSSGAYFGGVLAPNGDIHFVPFRAAVGQKISAAGVVSTYSLVYTTSSVAYGGGVLSPNGDIHFVPVNTAVGQKISASGVVSTYSLVYTTTTGAYIGGVLSPNGDIHFVPNTAPVGQKISVSGVVSTYSLVNTAGGYQGGVLAPNGDIHFVSVSAAVGQKISAVGVVSTYSFVYTTTSGYVGGVLRPDGSIVFAPVGAAVGQIISTNPGIALGQEACLSSYLNKL